MPGARAHWRGVGDDPRMTDYELIDAGDGRRLERFGSRLIDRPAPQVDGVARRRPDAWTGADASFDRGPGGLPGEWRSSAPVSPWSVSDASLGLSLELRLGSGGQVGLFPDHLAPAHWLAARAVDAGVRSVLHLFAYTGLATLALAAAGVAVTHVDSSRTAIAWARRNADLSGLADRPIRWIAEDAVAFVARERRRGRTYDGVVLDPPTYGHAAGGRSWRIDADLPELVAAVADLTGADRRIALLTTHSPGWDGDRLAHTMAATLGLRPEAGELVIDATSGARLALGAYARWSA